MSQYQTQSIIINSPRRQLLRGFTPIELVVTIAIFVIVSAILLSNYIAFNSRAILDNVAYEVALTVRQAQLYGVSGQEFSLGSEVFPRYGISVNSAHPTRFLLYADTNDNKHYDNSELLETFTFSGQNTISRVCGYRSITDSCTPLDTLDITFKRPDPDATFLATPRGTYAYVEIELHSGRESTRSVVIWSNGQITIQ